VLRPLERDLTPAANLDLVVFWHRTATLHSAHLRFSTSGHWTLPGPEEFDLALPQTTDPQARIFRNLDEGHCWSLNDVWSQLQQVANPFEGLVKGDRPVLRTACFPYPGNVAVRTPDGERRLGDLILSVALSLKPESVWQSEADKLAYGPPGETALQRVEFTSPHVGQDWHIALQAPADAESPCALRTSGSWPDPKRSAHIR
jgi:hypothetical protein